jgi:uncharacterized membrane protein
MLDVYILVSFFFIHIGLGRKISIPYAIALGFTDHYILLFAFTLDVLQIPFFKYLYTHTSKISIIKRLKEGMERRSEDMEGSKLIKWAKGMGKIGTVMLAAMPFQGGGMWSGVLLAHVIKLDRKQMYVFLSIGSLIGCTIMAYGTSYILSLF